MLDVGIETSTSLNMHHNLSCVSTERFPITKTYNAAAAAACCLLQEYRDLGTLGSGAKAQRATGITELLCLNPFKHHIVCILLNAFHSVTIIYSHVMLLPTPPLLQEYCDLSTLGVSNAK
jgi:hypothetical protein